MKKIATLIFALLALPLFSQKSEIKVFPQDSLEFSHEKIIKGLVSKGVKILDIEANFTPKSHAMGFFIDPVRYMGIEQGMILSTGIVDHVTHSDSQDDYTSFDLDSAQMAALNQAMLNDPEGFWKKLADTTLERNEVEEIFFASIKQGDDDLSKEIKGLTTFDARTITIKFIPTADTFYYRYVFASEEYDEYVCSMFNDIFAFYLYEANGKKINTALVPNQKLPVSINSINAGNPSNKQCAKTNPYLYIRNNGNQNLLFDGFTKVLDIRFKVVPGKEYYIKIAIADASDPYWDSAVLLENGSIFSYHQSFELHFNSESTIPNDLKNLEQIVAYIKKHPKCSIQLIGHADKPGTSDANYELSVQRVIEVRNLLITQGVSPDKIIEVYKGELMPRYKEDWRNRRVEIFVLGE